MLSVGDRVRTVVIDSTKRQRFVGTVYRIDNDNPSVAFVDWDNGSATPYDTGWLERVCTVCHNPLPRSPQKRDTKCLFGPRPCQ